MDELEKYYNYLKEAGADAPPTFESFSSTLADEGQRRVYYDYLRTNNFDTPDTYESFSRTLFPVKKKEPTKSKSEDGVSPQRDARVKEQEAFRKLIQRPAEKRPEIPTLTPDAKVQEENRRNLYQGMEDARRLTDDEILEIEAEVEEETLKDFSPPEPTADIHSMGVKPKTSKYENEREATLEEYSKLNRIPKTDIQEDELRGYYIQKRKQEKIREVEDQRLEAYISDLPDYDRVTLQAFREGARKELNDKNIHRSLVMEESLERAKEIEGQPELEEEYISNIERAYKMFNDINDDLADVAKVDQELDLLKRNYSTFDNFFGKMGAGFAELAVNLDTALSDFNELLGLDALPTPIQIIGERVMGNPYIREDLMQSLEQFADQQREVLRKPTSVGDINSINDFGKWATDLIAEQTPNVVMLASTGGVGLGALGTSAYGGKLRELEKIEKLGLGKYSPAQKRMAAFLVGGAEVLSERVSLGLLGKTKRFIKAADGDIPQIKNSVQQRLVELMGSAATEGRSEVMAQLSENVVDRYLLDRKDVNLWDGLADAFAAGAFMGGAVFNAPQIGSEVIKPFISKDTQQKIGENLGRIDELNTALGKTGNPESKKIIEEQIAKLDATNNKIIKNRIDKASDLPSEDVKKILNLEGEMYKVRQEYTNIQTDPSLSEPEKAQITASLDADYKSLSREKNEIINQKPQKDGTVFQEEKDVLRGQIRDENQDGRSQEGRQITDNEVSKEKDVTPQAAEQGEQVSPTKPKTSGKETDEKPLLEGLRTIRDETQEGAISSELRPQTQKEIEDAEKQQSRALREQSQQEEIEGVGDQDLSEVDRTELQDRSKVEEVSFDDFQKINISEKAIDRQGAIDRAINYLDRIDNELKQFGEETLGVNLPVTVARGGIKAMKTALKTAKTTADVINAGVEYIKGTDWFKNLSENDQKSIGSDIFKKVSDQVLKPIKRATKGETTLKAQPITRRQLLREVFTAREESLRQSYYDAKQERLKDVDGLKKRINEAKTKGFLSTNKAASLLKTALELDPSSKRQVNNFFDRLSKAMVLAEKKLSQTKLKRDIKRVKPRIKTTYNRFANPVRKLVRLKVDNIPEDSIEEYAGVMDMLAKAKDVEFDRVNELFADLQESYDAQIEQEYQDSLKQIDKTPKDKTKEEVLLQDVLSDFKYTKSDFQPYEQDIIGDFLNIPLSWIYENIDRAEIKRITKSLQSIKNGWIPSKVLNVVNDKYEGAQIAKNIDKKIGSAYVKPIKNLFDQLKSFIIPKKGITADDYTRAIKSVMLQHIDSVIKGVKGTLLYDNIIQPISSNFEKADAETKDVGNGLTRLIKQAKKKRGSRGGNYEFDLNTTLQFYFRQKEFESNPDLKNKKVFAMKDHMIQTVLTRANSQMSDNTIDRIFQLYQKFSTKKPRTVENKITSLASRKEIVDKIEAVGDIDLKKLEASLTPEETKIIELIRQELGKTENRNREVNDHRRGSSLVYPKDYFPRRSVGEKTDIDDVDMASNLSQLLGSTSTKAVASNKRSLTKAAGLNFNTFGSFMSHIQDANIEYNLSDAVKKTGIAITNLKKSDNISVNRLALALEKTIKSMIKVQMQANPYETPSEAIRFFNVLARNTYNRILIDPIRFSFDASINYATFSAFYADKLSAIIKSSKKIDQKFRTKLFKDFSSTQINRLGGVRTVEKKEVQATSIGKAKFIEAQPSLVSRMIDTFNKNTLTDFSDKASKLYYDITDRPAKNIWSYNFDQEFKKQSGEDFSKEKYLSDETYKKTNKRIITQAIKKADKSTANLFNTAAKAEQKLAATDSKYKGLARLNSFMKAFTFNENRVFWDSLHSIYGKGTMDRSEALRTFFIVNSRSMLYSFASQSALAFLLSQFFDEEEEEDFYEKAVTRAVAQHGQLIIMGNKGLLANIISGIAFEGVRELIFRAQGERYNAFDDALLYIPPKRASMNQYVGMMGAEGYAAKLLFDTYDLSKNIMTKYIDGEDITEEDYVKWKSYQIAISWVSQTTGLPIDRLGKATQKVINLSYPEKKKKKKKDKKQDK